jgi:AraC-like DNA-binding protein
LRYQEFAPCPSLQPYVDRYWLVEAGAFDTFPVEQLIVPNGLDALVLHYTRQRPTLLQQAGGQTTLPNNYILVQPRGSYSICIQDHAGVVGVFFRAGALRYLLAECLSQLAGRIIELETVWGNATRQISEQLQEVVPPQQIKVLEAFLLSRLSKLVPKLSHADYALQLINQRAGAISLGQLTATLRVSRQFIAREFQEKMGISPKLYCRVTRFNAAHRFLLANPKANWLDITYLFGYYDQSHLIKDFRQFTGLSPQCFTNMTTDLADFHAGRF